ncbi:MAG: Phosphorylated carbohydrates phosphatase [Chlamydiae bacterium]|nr:Phosphorylated carbohydrates phosphatase [Chlamydiota bacterium]
MQNSLLNLQRWLQISQVLKNQRERFSLEKGPPKYIMSSMRWMKQFDLFLLDLDGLLVDTEPLHFAAYQTLCKRHGYELPWNLQEYLGIAHASSGGLQKAIHPHLGEESWNVLYQEKKRIYLELLHSGEIALLPGVEAFLGELLENRVKRCVATNSCKEQVETIKDALPILKTIPVWITREDYENPKPAPDAYLKALELLADPGDRMIGFEDSLRGIQALERAGVLPVLICDPAHSQLNEALGVVHYPSFEQISDLNINHLHKK